MSSRELKVVILGDSSQAQRAFSQLSAAADGSQTKLQALSAKMNDVGSKMVNVGKKMTLGVTLPLALLGKKSFDAASDLNESFSKVSTVFGKAGKDIDAFSRTAAKSLGLSRQEALDAAGTFGNMFTQIGIAAPAAAGLSKEMIQLATDLGSFHNADITEVIDAQSSAFRGEYDALQKFIPTINAATVEQKALEMTGKKATKELTLQEKALAVQKLMMEGAGAATGDFARTADGAANKQRILTATAKDASATFGEKLSPIIEKVTTFLTGLADKFSQLSPKVQNFILLGAGLAAVLGPLVTVFGALAKVMSLLVAHPAIAAIALLAAGLIYAYTQSETFRRIVDGAFRGVAAAAGFMKDVALTSIQFLVDKFLAAAEWIVKAAAKAFGWLPGVGDDLKRASRAVEAFRNDVVGKLNSIPDKEITIRMRQQWDDAMNKPGFLRRRAHGGPVTSGTPYLVGEEGPELFVPGGNGQIIPNGATVGRGGSGVNVTMHVNVPNYVGDKSELIRAITKEGGGELTRFLIEEMRRYTGRGGTLGIA